MEVAHHDVNIVLYPPDSRSVAVLERAVIATRSLFPASLTAVPAGARVTVSRTVHLPAVVCGVAAVGGHAGWVASPTAAVGFSESVEGEPEVTSRLPDACVRVYDEGDAALCRVTIRVNLTLPSWPAAFTHLHLSYGLVRGAAVEPASHFLWPSHDVSFDWTLEPLAPDTRALDLFVFAPRSAAISWMPPWPHSSALFQPQQPLLTTLRDASLPPNTFATSTSGYVTPLAVQYASSCGVGHQECSVGVGHVYPLPLDGGDGVRWVRLSVLVQAVTWAHTKDIVTDLHPHLHEALNILSPLDMDTPGEGANATMGGEGEGEEGSVASGWQAVVLPATPAAASPLFANASRAGGKASQPHEHTWCWAMYKSEPGLLNSPLFLMSPPAFTAIALLSPHAPRFLVLLAGAVGLLLSLAMFVHMWRCAIVPPRPHQRLPLLLQFASHAFPASGPPATAGAASFAVCCQPAVAPHDAGGKGDVEDAGDLLLDVFPDDMSLSVCVTPVQSDFESHPCSRIVLAGDVEGDEAGCGMEEMGEARSGARPRCISRPGVAPSSEWPSGTQSPVGLLLSASSSPLSPGSPTPALLNATPFPPPLPGWPLPVACSPRRRHAWELALTRWRDACVRHCPRPVACVLSCLFGRVARVFLVASAIWAFFCLQSVVPVCALAIGGGSPWVDIWFWAKFATVVTLGPLATGIVTVRFWHIFLFAPPGGVLRRYFMDRVGRVLVVSSGFLLLLATWVCAVLLAATGVLHWGSLLFVFAVLFNALVTLWFLLSHDRIVTAAWRVFHSRSLTNIACALLCTMLVLEPFAAGAVASAYPGTMSLATFWKVQTGLGALLGMVSKVLDVLKRIQSRADAYEKKVKARSQQPPRRNTRFASY